MSLRVTFMTQILSTKKVCRVNGIRLLGRLNSLEERARLRLSDEGRSFKTGMDSQLQQVETSRYVNCDGKIYQMAPYSLWALVKCSAPYSLWALVKCSAPYSLWALVKCSALNRE